MPEMVEFVTIWRVVVQLYMKTIVSRSKLMLAIVTNELRVLHVYNIVVVPKPQSKRPP